MAMINTGEYEFDSIYNVMDFIKPLIIEGYSVATNTRYKSFPCKNSIDKFIVYVGEKGCKMAIYDPAEKACDNNG